jgi:hypothetical protein
VSLPQQSEIAPLPQDQRHGPSPDVSSSYVYVSEANAHDIKIFKKSTGKQVGMITWTDGSGAFGLSDDGVGNLYAARPWAKTVEVYKPLATRPFRVMHDANHSPRDVAVGSSGSVFTANYDGTISVYAPGSNTPTSTLTDSDALQNMYLALDAHENVYMTFVSKTTGSGAVAEFKNGSANPIDLGLKGLTAYVASIAIANNGNIVVCNQTVGILTYAPGRKSPISKIKATSDWVPIALNKRNSQIYIGAVNETVSLTYPAGAPQGVLDSTAFPIGVAILDNLHD